MSQRSSSAKGYFAFFAILLICCTSCLPATEGKWAGIKQHFPIRAESVMHLGNHPAPQNENQDTYLLNLPSLDSEFVQLLGLKERPNPPKALMRFRFGNLPWWGLVCLIDPGEASSSWTYTLVTFDSTRESFGPMLDLSEKFGDCGQEVAESWIVFPKQGGNVEIISRKLSYAVPDPEGEYCQEGWKPKYELQRRLFVEGRFLEASTYGIDPKAYPMDAEQEMRELFVSAGYEVMLE